MITNVTLIANSHAALWILSASRPPEDTAVFGAAVRLVALVNLPIVLANSVVAPIIVELYQQRKTEELETTLRVIATIIGIPSVAVLLGYFVFGGQVLSMVYGSYYEHGAVALAVLSIGQLASVCSGSCGLTLVMSGHQSTMMKITLACGACGIAMTLFCVKEYGVVGAAAASAATTVLQNFVMLVFVKRKAGVWTHARLSLVSRAIFAR
jgi:O-antigen/teichoic acid export membrane protein